MKLTVDREADALYLSLSEEGAEETREVAPGVLVDLDKNGQVVGIELLHLSKRAGKAGTNRLIFESMPLAG